MRDRLAGCSGLGGPSWWTPHTSYAEGATHKKTTNPRERESEERDGGREGTGIRGVVSGLLW